MKSTLNSKFVCYVYKDLPAWCIDAQLIWQTMFYHTNIRNSAWRLSLPSHHHGRNMGLLSFWWSFITHDGYLPDVYLTYQLSWQRSPWVSIPSYFPSSLKIINIPVDRAKQIRYVYCLACGIQSQASSQHVHRRENQHFGWRLRNWSLFIPRAICWSFDYRPSVCLLSNYQL
jgi:hypothetical protein